MKEKRKQTDPHFVLQTKYLPMTVLADGGTMIRRLAHQICSDINNTWYDTSVKIS